LNCVEYSILRILVPTPSTAAFLQAICSNKDC
jgi:hypothetical protein